MERGNMQRVASVAANRGRSSWTWFVIPVSIAIGIALGRQPQAMPPGGSSGEQPFEPDSAMVPAPDAARHAVAPADTKYVFVIETGSRLYPEWKEENRVRLNQDFYIADSQYSARITRFLPDFRIDKGQFVTASDSLLNPAVHIYVFSDSGAVDSTWAFKNFPPHFSPRSFYSFKLKDVLASDTAAPATPPAAEPKEK
jgi:hypothetical protein